MKIIFKNTAMLFVTAMIAMSCSSEQIVPKYYVIEPVREIQMVSAKKIPATVVIKPFYVSGIYNQKRIVYRSDSNELQYYFYHMWAEKPSLAIRYFIKAYFDNAKTFKTCSINAYVPDTQYYITGDIDKIERVKKKDAESISLKMSLRLVKADSGKIVAAHSFAREEAINEGIGMNIFAQELSKILTEEMNSFLQKIESQIKE